MFGDDPQTPKENPPQPTVEVGDLIQVEIGEAFQLEKPKRVRAERLSIGEREWLRGPLSRETSYRLIVTGDLGPKEIGKLIKLLKAQQSVLSDEDEDEDAEDEVAN